MGSGSDEKPPDEGRKSMNAFPANLPMVGTARLPEVYSHAKASLEACVRLDECQTWADKAEALASYAKQAEDDGLRKMADRIQARAIRRCGVLLKEIEPGHGARDGKRQEGTLPPLTRTDAATDAGLSEHQRKTALRVANIDKDEFEAAIEGDEPPTVTELAERGTVRKQPVPNVLIDDEAETVEPPTWAAISEEVREHLKQNRHVTVAGRSRWISFVALKAAYRAGKAVGWWVAVFDEQTGEYRTLICARCAVDGPPHNGPTVLSIHAPSII